MITTFVCSPSAEVRPDTTWVICAPPVVRRRPVPTGPVLADATVCRLSFNGMRNWCGPASAYYTYAQVSQGGVVSDVILDRLS